MNFSMWLENEADELEHQAADFIFSKIKQAWQLSIQNKQPIRSIMPQIWTNNMRGIKYFLPNDQFPSLSQIAIRFPPSTDESDTIRMHGQVVEFNFSLKKLDDAKNEQESQQALNSIGGTIHHEITHLHHKGADLDSSDTSGGSDGQAERAIKYMMSPGELQAHAKEYAFAWNRLFPNQAFNPQQFVQQVIPQIANKNKATNYFVAFADPIKQNKWKAKNLDLASAYGQIVKTTSNYVTAFNQKSQPQQSPIDIGANSNWQQNLAKLKSMGVDPERENWSRGEIIRGRKNK